MLTGARPGEILNARWDQLDLSAGVWRLEIAGKNKVRELRLTVAALILLAELPRWPGCAYLVPNPATKRPYRSVNRSWEAARKEAGLTCIELDDLRYCDLGTAVWEERLLDVARDVAGGAEAEGAAAGEGGVAPVIAMDSPPQLTRAA